MLDPFIILISSVLNIISLLLLVWVVMSLLISFDIINRYQPFVQRIFYILERLVQPMLRPIRRYMPDLGGIDLSPLVLILLIQFVQNALISWF